VNHKLGTVTHIDELYGTVITSVPDLHVPSHQLQYSWKTGTHFNSSFHQFCISHSSI